jgi:hypothetical protein
LSNSKLQAINIPVEPQTARQESRCVASNARHRRWASRACSGSIPALSVLVPEPERHPCSTADRHDGPWRGTVSHTVCKTVLDQAPSQLQLCRAIDRPRRQIIVMRQTIAVGLPNTNSTVLLPKVCRQQMRLKADIALQKIIQLE